MNCIFCGRPTSICYNTDKFGFQPVCLGDPNDGWKHSCSMQVWNNYAWNEDIRAATDKVSLLDPEGYARKEGYYSEAKGV